MAQIETNFRLDGDDRELGSAPLVTEQANLPETLAAQQPKLVKPKRKPVRVIVDERPSVLAPRRLDVQRMTAYAATRARRLGEPVIVVNHGGDGRTGDTDAVGVVAWPNGQVFAVARRLFANGITLAVVTEECLPAGENHVGIIRAAARELAWRAGCGSRRARGPGDGRERLEGQAV